MKLLVAILFLISAASAAQKCYTCSTTTKPACENLSDLSNIDTCVSTASEGINCVMYKFRLNGRDLDIVYRGCLTKDRTCDDEKAALQNEKKEMLDCRLCETDLCTNTNAVSRINLSNILSVITFIVIKLVN